MPLRLSLPPATRTVLVLLLGFTLVYQAALHSVRVQGATPLRFLVLTATLPTALLPWVYATSTLAEGNIVTLAVAGAVLFYAGKYLERAWSSREFALFLVIVGTVPNILAVFPYALVHSLRHATDTHPSMIHGSIAWQAGFLVAFKQLVPEHTVTLLRGLLAVRVKHFPALFLAANILSGLLLRTHVAAVLALGGFLTSWVYLRFYKSQSTLTDDGSTWGASGQRGDASDTFAFAAFWPDAVHAPVSAVSDAIYYALVSAGLLRPFSAAEVESSNQQATARGSELPSLMSPGARRLGGSSRGYAKREEAERRRALALRALDQRLQATAQESPSSRGPSLDEPMTTPSSLSAPVQAGSTHQNDTESSNGAAPAPMS